MSNDSSSRFWRFSTRQLLVLVLVVAALCALWTQLLQKRQQENQVEQQFDRQLAGCRALEKAVLANDVDAARQVFKLDLSPQQLLANRGGGWASRCSSPLRARER